MRLIDFVKIRKKIFFPEFTPTFMRLLKTQNPL